MKKKNLVGKRKHRQPFIPTKIIEYPALPIFPPEPKPEPKLEPTPESKPEPTPEPKLKSSWKGFWRLDLPLPKLSKEERKRRRILFDKKFPRLTRREKREVIEDMQKPMTWLRNVGDHKDFERAVQEGNARLDDDLENLENRIIALEERILYSDNFEERGQLELRLEELEDRARQIRMCKI